MTMTRHEHKRIWDQATRSNPLIRFLSRHFLSEGVVPGKPKELEVTEATKNYVVLSWKPPGERGHEGIMYYVEKVRYTVYTSLTSHT